MYVSGRVGGADAVASLRERARRKVLATWNLGRIGSMAAWWEDFLMTTDRVPFVALATTGDLAGAIYNAQTLELFAEFIRDRGSRAKGHTGEPLTADYISTLVATARLVRSGEAHYNVAPSEASTSISTMFKSMREEDGPRGGNERRESRGFRARDFKAIAASFDRLTHMGLMEWTVALTAWNMLLRGGEVGRPTGKIFDASIGITVAGVQMREPCAASGMRPWLTVDVTSIKDQKRRNRPVPVPVAQRGGGVAGGDDALCVYTHIKAVYERRCRQLPKMRRRVQLVQEGEWECEAGGQAAGILCTGQRALIHACRWRGVRHHWRGRFRAAHGSGGRHARCGDGRQAVAHRWRHGSVGDSGRGQGFGTHQTPRPLEDRRVGTLPTHAARPADRSGRQHGRRDRCGYRSHVPGLGPTSQCVRATRLIRSSLKAGRLI
jgi:hypothetical protein